MPFAPISNPDLAGEFMARGISQAGTGLASGLQRAMEGMQSKSKERKTYLGLADALNSQGLLDDHTRAALSNADTDTIKGTLDGLITANTLKHVGFNNDLLKQHIDAANTEKNQMAGLNQDLSAAADTNDNPALGNFYENPEQYPNGRPQGALDADTMLRAAARHGLLGNVNVDRFISAMERAEARRADKAELATSPQFQDVPGTDSVLARLGKVLQIVPKTSAGFQPALDATTGEPIPGAYNFGGRIVQVPQPNAASQEKLGVEKELEAHKLLRQLNQDIDSHLSETRAWEESQKPRSWYQSAPDPVIKPDPARLKALQKQKARVESMLDGTETPAATTTSAARPVRVTDIEPPIGEVKVGKDGIRYSYVGGYGRLDKRSWKRIP